MGPEPSLVVDTEDLMAHARRLLGVEASVLHEPGLDSRPSQPDV